MTSSERRRGEKSSRPSLTLPHDDPVAIQLALAVHFGQLDILKGLLTDRPELASVGMIGRKGLEGGWRTPLHVATD